MNIELVKVRRKKNRLLITEAIELFAFTLLHPRTVEVLDIIVEMKDLGHADGYCGWEDSNINPRSFTIELDKKLAGSELIKTIAHEMVHLKQFAKGELKERFKPTYRHIWHGDIVDVGLDNFYEVPWEVEAREMEEDLFLLFESRVMN
tara:strand:+ start:5000 stop:5443 length:444 start_codon:yes stop_codon:yes gene_type:complete